MTHSERNFRQFQVLKTQGEIEMEVAERKSFRRQAGAVLAASVLFGLAFVITVDSKDAEIANLEAVVAVCVDSQIACRLAVAEVLTHE